MSIRLKNEVEDLKRRVKELEDLLKQEKPKAAKKGK